MPNILSDGTRIHADGYLPPHTFEAHMGEWTAMGAGVIDFPQIVTRLRDTGYGGWIMIEEESFEAETDPDAATLKNGDYLRQTLLPLV